VLVRLGLLKVTEARLQLGDFARVERARDADELVEPALLSQNGDGLHVIGRSDVGVGRRGEIVGLFRPDGLSTHQLLRLIGVGVVCEVSRLVPLAEVGEHLYGALDAVGLAEELGRLLELALEGEHGGDEHVVVVSGLLALALDASY